jgi:hypothetical protein
MTASEVLCLDLEEVKAEHKAAMAQWRRRERAAERRSGYARTDAVATAANAKHSAVIEALRDATLCTIASLIAKVRACRANRGDDELAVSLMWDIGVVAGEVGPSELAA